MRPSAQPFFSGENEFYLHENEKSFPTSGLLLILRSDWLSYYQAVFSTLVAKSAGFENQKMVTESRFAS